MGKEEKGPKKKKMWLFRVKTFIESRYLVGLQAGNKDSLVQLPPQVIRMLQGK